MSHPDDAVVARRKSYIIASRGQGVHDRGSPWTRQQTRFRRPGPV
jgi:hypothetical protein